MSEEKIPNIFYNLTKGIGKMIGDSRIIRGLTLKEVAQEIGVSHQQLAKYEKGKDRIATSRLLVFFEIIDKYPVKHNKLGKHVVTTVLENDDEERD